MELTLTQHTNLVIQVDRPDIQTVDALFVKMLGDRTAAKMFTRLLYWFPKAVKFGRWVYKSWRDWDAECGLSPAQIKRVHHEGLLERFGMTRKLKKAPKDYSPQHPAIELLRLKDFSISHPVTDAQVAQADFAEYTAQAWRILKPFNDFLNTAVEE